MAVYQLLKDEKEAATKEIEITKMFDDIVSKHEVIDWNKRQDIINKIELDFGDYLMDVIDFSMDKADELTKKAIDIAIANK